jgi:amidase
MRRLLGLIVAASATAASVAALPIATEQPKTGARPFSVVDASIADLRAAMESGRTTSRELTEQYLGRIDRFKDLHAAIAVNPRAVADAEARDLERRQRKVRGPLHGIPIALKDNIHTLDMPTTGGALAFAGLRPPYEATLTRRLLDAGAVIIAKTTLTELANWVSSNMPAGYNSTLGFSFNPYEPRRAASSEAPLLQSGGVLSPGGSSSGIGTAASLWAANVGTETSGSILNPANQNMLVGIKPTVGRISRHGVIPITADQDTPGPIARSVADAAILLGAMEGNAPDPADPATKACKAPAGRDYTRHLRRNGLKGARIGIPRAFFATARRVGVGRGAPLTDAQQATVGEAITALRAAGATVVDPADLPSVVTTDPDRNILDWPICFGPGTTGRGSIGCSIVLRYGMKRDFNQWLVSLGGAAPVRTLTELRAWNAAHERDGTLRFGQDQLDASDAIDLDADRARYQADRAKDLALAGREGIDAALRANRLDALLFPGFLAASISARAGYPTVIVPFVAPSGAPPAGAPSTSPADGGVLRQPLGISFTGSACSEPRLIELAYAFEQATRRRIPPRLD